MMPTNFWLIRHALVAENERATLYGVRDVQLCPDSLVAQVPMYQALAARLPQPAAWICTPLSRTRRTAEAIFKAGYPAQDLAVEPDLIEQNLGDYQGLRHAALPPLLAARRPIRSGRWPPTNGRPTGKAWPRFWSASAWPWSAWPSSSTGATWWS